MPDRYEELSSFSEADVEAFLEEEIALDRSRYQQHLHPGAILLAGQPGAGKTELSTMILSMLNGDAAFINGDDYRRYHPNYRKLYRELGSDSVQLTSKFSAVITEGLIARLSDFHLNLVIEGTGRTVEVPQTTAEQLAIKGYTVEMAVIAVRPEISLISTMLRFYQMNEGGTIPRATALQAHDRVVTALPSNLDILLIRACFSRIRIWDRDLKVLYDSLADRHPPSEVLLGYWHRAWDPNEIKSAEALIAILKEKEQASKLGQEAAICEIERRIHAAYR